MKDLVKIRNKKIYIEVLGEQNKDALLYLHGGPGASCYDLKRLFMNVQILIWG